MSLNSSGRNLILARLPLADCQRLMARMRPVRLDFKQILYKATAPIDYVYFPLSGAASALTVMQDGSAIEVATIGNEGVIGNSVLFAGKTSPNELIVQVAGEALRMDADVLPQEAEKDSPLHRLLLSYNQVFLMQISQSVACNGLHPIQQRCCRWLLITLDRMQSNVVPLTHEFLAIMLGVRRASVTDVLHPLHEQGLVNNSRGAITILDRAGLEKLSCECYRRLRDEFDQLES
ncbi:MAG TPA: Crp/Fnr family transcriptional regulator [Pirellulales bacterium]|jgi:CRP-like cAMP-binding protein|nr:Crp/Fnr family transcriptional regulator [Pirellulales bacterium]